MNWQQKLLKDFFKQIEKDEILSEDNFNAQMENPKMIHLAIFSEPFLSKLIDGTKTVESRFSKRNISPFGDVSTGDVILVKKSGGLIKGFFVAGEVLYYPNLNKKTQNLIKKDYGKAICDYLSPNFWEDREDCNYASLVKVMKYYPLSQSIDDLKTDRRGWVLLTPKVRELPFK